MKYEFYEAAELKAFLKRNANKICEEEINNIFYVSGGCPLDFLATPLILEFKTFAVIIEYYFHSELLLEIIDIDSFHKYRAENSWNLEEANLIYKLPVKIENIEIARFSQRFEASANGWIRPRGGDYFASIAIFIKGRKRKLRIAAHDASVYGYMSCTMEPLDTYYEDTIGLKIENYDKIL